ncbi:hypothetical protein [Streptomyces drozdowiczii]|uniref:HTH cro/C1-type domain-containing protein n=1 Tax=Streptomyces drozdowiczii TaxID=202862 RepID=A0ABY6PU13_9ACTN|nr:hypothetical protein [Streptomyces drozdowiczii]MCX0245006.1 hypothetical protein [Streptomyces drozdowiczii]UZK55294.1 hypothetical protein NEH16_15215 [Streptomyces drozdowiczii]
MTEVETARGRLGSMLSGLLNPDLALRELSKRTGVARSTLQGWMNGRSAPVTGDEDAFWSVVELLRETADQEGPTDAQWAEALRAAQGESAAGQAQQRYVGVHRPAHEAPTTPPRDRTAERAVMNAFARETRAGAAAYLCWCADAPTGKTSLLADYVLRHRPDKVDILSYFVSSAHHTDTLAAFESEMARQVGTFLGEHPVQPPHGAAEWHRLFARAAAKSRREKRNLLLVVDGLDDDAAWPGAAADSIAGLLPPAPPRGMRVLVSLRSCVRPPDDLPSAHPLRDIAYRHVLGHVEGAAHDRQPRPDPTALGRSVAGMLAVSGGGLRTEDLADLVGVARDRLDRLFQGPAGRSLVLDDRVAGAYRLAGPQLEREVWEELGDAGVAQCTHQLVAWIQNWQAADWPTATPPFALAAPPVLFSALSARTAYVLDPARLHRLSEAAGVGAALDQLSFFEATFTGTSDDLAALVPLAAARDMVRRGAREVPEGAPPLLARLGEVARARGHALSASDPIVRAVHLADLAVELALAKRPCADAVVREAAECLPRNRGAQTSSGGHPPIDVWARLLASAVEVHRAAGSRAAKPLLLAVVDGHGAGVGEIADAGRLLAEFGDLDLVPALIARAETLSAGPPRAQAASVDIWAALARAKGVDSSLAGDRIEEICAEVERDDALGAVEVLAASASALVRFPAPRPRKAAVLVREAQALSSGFLSVARTGLPDEEQARMRPVLKGALARLAHALADTKATPGDLRRLDQQLDSLPEPLSTGVLGELMAERGKWVIHRAEERLAHQERELADKEAEREGQRRALKQERRRRQDRKNDRHKRAMDEWKAGGREGPVPVPDPAPKPHVPLPPAPRRTPPHRRTWGLPTPTGDPRDMPPHRLLLQEAEDLLRAGNHEASRDLLDTALRAAPLLQTPTAPNAPGNQNPWTADLCQALGTIGAFDDATALVTRFAEPVDRARHLAALSVGSCLSGHDAAGAEYAHAARKLLPDDADPVLAARVNQALAYAGADSAALAPIKGGTSTQRRQAGGAVAVGLARHRPEEAARLAESLAAQLARRIAAPNRTGPFRVLPELAALLLAAPDVLAPDSPLRNSLHQAVREVTGSPAPQHAPTMTVLALLGRLGVLSEETAETAETTVSRWRRSLRPGPGSAPEIALLAAVDGDTELAWRHAESLSTPAEQSLALGAVAAHLAGVEIPPTTDPQADDRTVRLCLALARAASRDTPSRPETARHTVHRLLGTGGWTRAFPALPSTAPEALPHLTAIALHTAPGR